MSALDHKRTSQDVRVMSALPPKADIAERDYHVRFVPQADITASLDFVLGVVSMSAKRQKQTSRLARLHPRRCKELHPWARSV